MSFPLQIEVDFASSSKIAQVNPLSTRNRYLRDYRKPWKTEKGFAGLEKQLKTLRRPTTLFYMLTQNTSVKWKRILDYPFNIFSIKDVSL